MIFWSLSNGLKTEFGVLKPVLAKSFPIRWTVAFCKAPWCCPVIWVSPTHSCWFSSLASWLHSGIFLLLFGFDVFFFPCHEINHSLFWMPGFSTELAFATLMLFCWTPMVFQGRTIYLCWTPKQLDTRSLWINLFGFHHIWLKEGEMLNKLWPAHHRGLLAAQSVHLIVLQCSPWTDQTPPSHTKNYNPAFNVN